MLLWLVVTFLALIQLPPSLLLPFWWKAYATAHASPRQPHEPEGAATAAGQSCGRESEVLFRYLPWRILTGPQKAVAGVAANGWILKGTPVSSHRSQVPRSFSLVGDVYGGL